jgi:hypothetical protein
VQENEKREYGDAFLLICGQNLNLKKGYKKKLEDELLQHSYSLSSLRDFKKSRGFMMTLLKPLRSFK